MATGTYFKGRQAEEVTEQVLTKSSIDTRGRSRAKAVQELLEVDRHGTKKTENRLIAGDNRKVLHSLLSDPTVAGRVQLIYIDPPYATGFDFESATVGPAYQDRTQGTEYFAALRERVLLMHALLSKTGSFYIHLDHNAVFGAKLLLDEIFGPQNFRNMITRIKCNPKNQVSKQYGDVCDYILFYTKSNKYTWHAPVVAWGDGEGEREYTCVEPGTGRRYKKVPCHLPGIRNGATGSRWRGKLPPKGKHWVHSPAELDRLDAEGRIYWSRNGNPRRKLYLDENEGRRRQNIWTDYRDTQNQNARVTGYPTEKNLDMLRMIIKTSSNEGDLVMDAYAGSGTTLAAASAENRSWIGIDSSATAIRVCKERLLKGTPRMGSHARDTFIKRTDDERDSVPISFRYFERTVTESKPKSVAGSKTEPELSLVTL